MESYITLSNGVKMPMLGYGTIGQSGNEITENVAFALNHGYKLIDTANRYGNEVEVGEGLKASGLKREDYFLETKLGPTLYENDGAIDGTLKRLNVDYIDLMILHHPVNNYIYAYKMLEKAYKEGKLRAIGLSNFPVDKIEDVLKNCEIPPMVMQVEGHPYYPAEAAKAFCDAHQIVLQCWFPLGHGSQELLCDPVVVQLAEKYSKTPAQIVLRWHIQMGFCPVPGSKSKDHIRENGEIFDFALTDDDMAAMAGINRHTPFYKVTPESLHRMAVTKCNFEE
ncbi:MAG TPA: aldo/keto reductase [Candidatus Scybalocola faecigallinarum]|uniref:Aldo/keto reductase n=1 Tax=Candidatus Scybalocola faecigallinarum TaxID=2840941 RepID=A0A9D1F2B9_9FIRM|nr:aldo/keto reductase [Candidatus Scybalocola faecigallinarum]